MGFTDAVGDGESTLLTLCTEESEVFLYGLGCASQYS